MPGLGLDAFKSGRLAWLQTPHASHDVASSASLGWPCVLSAIGDHDGSMSPLSVLRVAIVCALCTQLNRPDLAPACPQNHVDASGRNDWLVAGWTASRCGGVYGNACSISCLGWLQDGMRGQGTQS